MPLKRTPPPTSPMNFATPLAHYNSDTNVSTVGQLGDDLSAASSLSSINTRNVKRKRDIESEDTVEIIKSDSFEAWQEKQDLKLDAILNSIADIKISFNYLSTKYEDVLNRVGQLEEENKAYKNKIELLEKKIDILEHKEKTTSLEIRNLPPNKNETKEDLLKAIKCTAEVLEVPLDDSEIKDIYRVNTKSAVKPIIADFTTVIKRDKFLSSYKKYNKEHSKEKFNTSNINIAGSHKVIYISENLTLKERNLFFLAREFAKAQSYMFCWTSFGRVFLRKTGASPQVRIYTENDLQDLFIPNE